MVRARARARATATARTIRVYPFEAIAELSEIKCEVHQEKRRELASTEVSVFESLSNPLKKAKELASEKGASSWFTALPIANHGFCLQKRAFRNALCLRYNWSPPLPPSSCVCCRPVKVSKLT